MIQKLFKTTLFLFINALIYSPLSSQELLYNVFIPDSVGIGEKATLLITLDQKNASEITSLSLENLNNLTFYPFSNNQNPDSLKTAEPEIIINSLGLWEDTDNDGILSGAEIKWNKIVKNDSTFYQNEITITPLDVGFYLFDGFVFEFNGNIYKSNQILLSSIFKEYKQIVVDSTGMAPIKNIEREGFRIFDLLKLLWIIIPLLAISWLYYYLKNKRKSLEPADSESVIILPPDVLALTQLKELREKELWQKGDIKSYQSALSKIVREYLEGRYNIKALENTTRQIVLQLKNTSFDLEDVEKLTRILQISDLVKFAKARPDIDIHEEFMLEAIAFVQKTKKDLEIENSEEE